MPFFFLVPSEQCPWKLLLQLQPFLLIALRSSAVSVWFRMVLPRPEQWEWQLWLITPSRWNLPCSKGWKISVSNLLTLPFVPALQPHFGSAPVPELAQLYLFKKALQVCSSVPTLRILLYLHEMYVEYFYAAAAALFPFMQGLEQKWEAGLKDWPNLTEGW